MSSEPPNGRAFTWADLERWADEGLIARSQIAAIRAAEPEAIARPPVPTSQPREARHGLNFVTVVYYIGAFLILFAYTVFMGLQWEGLSPAGQFTLALVTVAALLGIGAVVRRAGYEIGGGLLIFAGTGIVPLVVYSFQHMAGLWPESGPEFHYEDFYDVISSAWVFMEVITILVTIAVLWWVRFPLLVLLLSFWLWFLSMDLARWIVGDDEFDYSGTEQVIGVLFAVATLGVGVALQRRGLRDYSFWLYLFGHLMLLPNLGDWALDEDQRALRGIVFLLVYVAVVAASVWLQSRIFLVFGAIGVYCYVGYLAFEIFEDALGFTFSLAFIGLLLILGAIGFQRYLQPWWSGRAGRPRGAA
ncbi:MAG: DUF2157 domain-containing protein [Chloroflexia bacterium]|nr:DUF2157 domain-containing protein [Chloroflexia bacterium]